MIMVGIFASLIFPFTTNDDFYTLSTSWLGEIKKKNICISDASSSEIFSHS